MSCNNMKSAIQKYYTVSQAITATASPLNMGATALRTSTAIADTGTGFTINRNGLYRLNANILVTATVAGTVTAQLTANGTAIPGSSVSVPVAVGSQDININTLARFNVNGCCRELNSVPVSVVISSSDATATVTGIYVNALKEA